MRYGDLRTAPVHGSAAAQPRLAPSRERRCRGADRRPLTLPGACTRRASEAEKLSFVGEVEPLSALVKGALLLSQPCRLCVDPQRVAGDVPLSAPRLSPDLVAASERRTSLRRAAPCASAVAVLWMLLLLRHSVGW